MARKKYGNGTQVTNYIDNPYEVLQEDDINKDKATYESESNPMTQIMSVLGESMMQYGMQQGGTGSNLLNTGLMAANKIFGNGGSVDGPGDDEPITTLAGGVGVKMPPEYANAYNELHPDMTLPEGAYLTQQMYDDYTTTGKIGDFEAPVEEPEVPQAGFVKIPVNDTRGRQELVYAPDNETFNTFNDENPMSQKDWRDSEYYKTNQWKQGKSGVYEHRGFEFGLEPNLSEDPNKYLYQGSGPVGSGRTNQWLINQQQPSITSGVPTGAYGLELPMMGNRGNVPVNIEGNEVIETPDGQLLETEGPSHENGGINTTLPPGSKVYSNRIKIQGETMQERKKKREKKKSTLSDLLEINTSDVILKGSMNRVTTTNAEQEEKDMFIQKSVDTLLGGNPAQFGNGGDVEDEDRPIVATPSYPSLYNFGTEQSTPRVGEEGYRLPILPPSKLEGSNIRSLEPIGLEEEGITPVFDTEEDEEIKGLTFPDITGGDALSISGNLMSTFGPYLNTLKNRAGDTPNINAFRDFGVEGIDKLDEASQYLEQIKANKLREAELSKTGALKRVRGSARGVNTMRALDLATEQMFNENERGIYDQFAEQMLGVTGQQAQAEFMQDKAVMSGEQQRDLFDRMDDDNFSTQLAQNIVGMGTGLQETGKDINSIKEREVVNNLLSQLSKYGLEVDNQGNVIQGD